MNNQVEQVRTPEIIAQEIRGYTAMMLNSVIEIGRRMCEVKEMLPHGSFGNWIKENTDYSVSTANNFMKLFTEYADEQITLFGAVSNSQTFGNLSYTKALALLSLPSEEREGFAKNNNVEDMSTRELKAAIAKIKALEDDNQNLKDNLKEVEKDLSEAEEELEKLRDAADNPIEAAVTATDAAEVQKAVEEALAKAAKEHAAEMDAVMKKLNASAKETDKLEKKLLDAKKAVQDAENKVSSGSAQYIAEAKKAKAEVERLRREVAMADPVTAEFKGLFEQASVIVTKLVRLVSEAPEASEPNLRAALKALGKQIAGE